nr:protein like COV 1-like [Tanacetum cinerariifolium]
MPFVRHIYNASKQISSAISPDQNTQALKEVAIIRHPRIGEYAYGFITSSVILQTYSDEEELYSVYVPTNHLYIGDIFLVNSKDVIRPNLSVREGIEIVLWWHVDEHGEYNINTNPFSFHSSPNFDHIYPRLLIVRSRFDPDPAKTKTIPRGIASSTALHLPTQMAHRHGVDKKKVKKQSKVKVYSILKRDIYLLGFQRLMEMVKKQAGQAAEMASVKSKKPMKQERKNVRIAKIEEKLGYEMIYVFGDGNKVPDKFFLNAEFLGLDGGHQRAPVRIIALKKATDTIFDYIKSDPKRCQTPAFTMICEVKAGV